jgi:hypothetical protein
VPEPLGELDDAARLGAAERVDGLVGVADGDQVPSSPGEQLEQLDLGGVGVLVLVDEQPAGPLALLAQQLGVAVELGDRCPHQFGGVVTGRVAPSCRREGGDTLVLLLERGGEHPVVATGLLPPGRQLGGGHPALGGAHEQVAQLGAEPGRPEGGRQGGRPADGALLLGVTPQQLGDDGVLLGGGEEPGWSVTAQQRRAAEDAVGVGVERAGQRLADRARDPAGDPRAQLGRGLAAERQDEDLLGVDACVDAGRDGLDDGRRLSRARPGEDQQRAGRVVDDGLLGGVEQRSREPRSLTGDEPVDRRRSPLCHPPMESRRTDTSGAAGATGRGASDQGESRLDMTRLEHQVRSGRQPAGHLQQRPLALAVEGSRRRDETGLGHGPARDVVHALMVGRCAARL